MARLHQLEAFRVNQFQAHCRITQLQFLEPWIQSTPTPPAGNGEILAVIIDDRPSDQLRACVLNTLLMGWGNWSVRVITAPIALEPMRQLLRDLNPWVKVEEQRWGTSQEFGWAGCNGLMKSAAFWTSLQAEKVLIFQTDTLIIEPPDPRVFSYGYVGAPWAKGRVQSECFPSYGNNLERQNSVWESRGLCGSVPEGAMNGNGGLSVRHPKLMAQICAAQANKSPVDEAEDLFFARHLPHYDKNPAPTSLIEGFACETQYRPCSGAHASWRYISAADQAELYERHIKTVIARILAVQPKKQAQQAT